MRHTHAHARIIAPIMICIAFGFAIIGIFPIIFMLPEVQSIVSRKVTYEECYKMRDSQILTTYPPECVAPDGRTYTKNLPKVKMPVAKVQN